MNRLLKILFCFSSILIFLCVITELYWSRHTSSEQINEFQKMLDNQDGQILVIKNKLITMFSDIKELEKFRQVSAGPPVEILNEIGKPYAVLTIDYGEQPRNFEEGGFYVLKVLKVRGTKIDYGFCPIKRNNFYANDD